MTAAMAAMKDGDLQRLLLDVQAYQDVVIGERMEPLPIEAMIEDLVATVPEWASKITDWRGRYLFYCVRFRYHLIDADAIDYRETRKRKMGALQRRMQKRRAERYGKR